MVVERAARPRNEVATGVSRPVGTNGGADAASPADADCAAAGFPETMVIADDLYRHQFR
jgi:hypothetical protein